MPTETAILTQQSDVLMLKPNPLTNWTGQEELPFELIAERHLELHREGEKGPLVVSFGKPTFIEGKGWCCLYRMSSMGHEYVTAAGGSDSLHAMQEALEMVHKQLSAMARSHTITFLGQSNWGFRLGGSPDASSSDAAARCPVVGMSVSS